MSDNTISHQDGIHTVTTTLVTCHKCGHRIVAEAVSTMARTIPTLGAVCLTCIEPSDQFRAAHPDVAAAIDGWKEGTP